MYIRQKNSELTSAPDISHRTSSSRGCFDTEADGWPWGFSPVQPEGGNPALQCAWLNTGAPTWREKKDPGAGTLLTLKSWMKSVISPSYRQYTNCTIWNWSGFLKKRYTSYINYHQLTWPKHHILTGSYWYTVCLMFKQSHIKRPGTYIMASRWARDGVRPALIEGVTWWVGKSWGGHF